MAKHPVDKVVDEYFSIVVSAMLNQNLLSGKAYTTLFKGADAFLREPLKKAWLTKTSELGKTIELQEAHIQELEATLGTPQKSGVALTKHSDDPLQALLSHPAVSHQVFGAFDNRPGHFMRENKGSVTIPPEVAQNERHFFEGFPSAKSQMLEQGLAKIKVMHSSFTGVYYKLMFADYRSDARIGSHTDYVVFVPADLELVMRSALSKDPAFLIRLFKAAYPTYYMGGRRVNRDPKIHLAADPWVRKES